MNPKCYLPFVYCILCLFPFSLKGQDSSSWTSEKMMAIQKAEENQRLDRLSSPEYLYESQVWQSPNQQKKSEDKMALWIYLSAGIILISITGISFRLYFQHQQKAQKQKIIWNKIDALKNGITPEWDGTVFYILAREVLEKLDRQSLEHTRLNLQLSPDAERVSMQFICSDAAHSPLLGSAISKLLLAQPGSQLHVEKQADMAVTYFLSFPRTKANQDKNGSEAAVSATQETPLRSVDQNFLVRARQVVAERMGDSEFNAEAFREEMGMSKTHFYRKIQELSQQSPGQFIRNMRLMRARQLLEAGSGNVSEIAYEVGFNNLSYFSRCFRREFGVLPSEVN